MIERMDVLRCDNLLQSATRVNDVYRCLNAVPALFGRKRALAYALTHGWQERRTPEGRKRHLCPSCAAATEGRTPVLAEPAARA